MTVIIIIKLIDTCALLCYNTKNVYSYWRYTENTSAPDHSKMVSPHSTDIVSREGYGMVTRMAVIEDFGGCCHGYGHSTHLPRNVFGEQYEVRYDSIELFYKEQKSVSSAEQRDAQIIPPSQIYMEGGTPKNQQQKRKNSICLKNSTL